MTKPRTVKSRIVRVYGHESDNVCWAGWWRRNPENLDFFLPPAKGQENEATPVQLSDMVGRLNDAVAVGYSWRPNYWYIAEAIMADDLGLTR